MMLRSIALAVVFAATDAFQEASFAQYDDTGSSECSWDLKKFSTLVAFGDSYTDDSRLSYVGSHNGSYPPVGYANPVVSAQ